MIAPTTPVLIGLCIGAVLLAGCESTQSKSAQIAADLGPVKQEQGLEIGKESEDIEVLDTTLLSDANGTAVVVQVRNSSDETLVDVPLAINVVDGKGKSVYKNDIPGLEPALTAIPLIKPGETLDWVNSQVLPIGEPVDVKVTVGAEASPLEGEVPDIEVGEPELEKDSVSGINAAGSAVNNTDIEQARLTIFGVARRDGKIVAAGRAAVNELNPGRQRTYHVYFIGDPEGAEVSVSSFPTLETTQQTNGDSGG